jgi:fibro-slime domain-containing protein
MAMWPYDLDASGNKRLHNFSFTSEVRYWFKYEAGKTFQLDLVGDDDVWVFINKKLAVDLGGIHTPAGGSVTLDATTASGLGLVDGQVYETAIFQAERQSTSSSFKLTLSGFNAAPSECAPCTDGIMAGGGGCASAAGGAGGAPGTTGTGGTTGGMTGVPSGGASTTGGNGATGGKGGAGGTSYIGASGITTSPFAGNGGASGPPDTSAGGAGATGGVGGAINTTPVTPLPTDALAVYVVDKFTSSTGQISLSLRVDNMTADSVDMSTVTLRYWYQDEGLGVGAALELDFATVGISNAIRAQVHGTVVAASAPVAGADHYLEVSFGATTLSAKGNAGHNDQLKFNGRLHNSGYQGAVDVTNDYSYNGGKTGYDTKITLYQNGKLISGVEPGGKG